MFYLKYLKANKRTNRDLFQIETSQKTDNLIIFTKTTLTVFRNKNKNHETI